MTKEEAIQFIIRLAKPHCLETECMELFTDYCTYLEKNNLAVDYRKEAMDALYEWDI